MPMPDLQALAPAQAVCLAQPPSLTLCGKAWTEGWPYTRIADKLRAEEMLQSIFAA